MMRARSERRGERPRVVRFVLATLLTLVALVSGALRPPAIALGAIDRLVLVAGEGGGQRPREPAVEAKRDHARTPIRLRDPERRSPGDGPHALAAAGPLAFAAAVATDLRRPSSAPGTWRRPAPTHAELMVFLN